MSPTDYDEATLIRDLGRVSSDARVAFAASCAQRLLPAYARYWQRTARGEPETLAQILERVWQHLLGERMSIYAASEAVSRCMGLIPGEPAWAAVPPSADWPWVDELPYADDASSAVTYALRALQSGKAQEAAWAARRAHDAAAYYVTHHLGIDSDSIVRAHPIVVAEVSRQRRDLDELIAADRELIVERLRDRAKDESLAFFRWPK